MAEEQPAEAIAPKDVFQRANMPSRWERIVGVSPKTVSDRKYLAFVAARYRGDERLPRPDALVVPDEVRIQYWTQRAGWLVVALAAVITIDGVNRHLSAMVTVGIVLLIAAFAVMLAAYRWAVPTIMAFNDIQSRSKLAQAALRANPMHRKDTDTIDEMITCDEGTLIYCAAKIASEIEQDPAWGKDAAGFVAIDLWEELAEISASARQIAEDRRATAALERGRLRDDLEMRAVINEDKQQRREAHALLAARVHAFADYRDRIHRIGVETRRERTALNRAVRQVVDGQARERLR
jgi:hypothetical protein